jgi:hypothetical protein
MLALREARRARTIRYGIVRANKRDKNSGVRNGILQVRDWGEKRRK